MPSKLWLLLLSVSATAADEEVVKILPVVAAEMFEEVECRQGALKTVSHIRLHDS